MLHEYSKLYQKACERSSKSEITFIPRMGWLRTMKILSYLVLTVLLTNFNQVAGASTVSSLPGLVTINNSTAATASNSNTTIFSRDRSTKVSSERIKASSKNEESTTNSPSFTLSRRVPNGRVRDNKLMTVLNARRRLPTRWISLEECDRNCQTVNTSEYCKLKCSRDMKLIRNGGNNSFQSASGSSGTNEMSTSDSNVVMQTNAEEFLDTEESVHGFSFAEPMSNGTGGNKQTKEYSNLITSGTGKLAAVESKKVLKNKTNGETTTLPVTTKASRRNKVTKASLSAVEVRPTAYRGRVKFSPSSKKTFEENDADSYLFIEQKLPSSTTRTVDSRRQLGGRRTPLYQSTTPSRSKEEELEIMEVSVAKQSSTEKNGFWKTRNIVAINNYMRRLNPHLTTKVAEKIENTTKLTTVKYETLHTQPEEGQSSTAISSVNNLAEGTDDVKNIFSRSTMNSSHTESPIEMIYRPLPSLIINVPDDATPIFFNDPRHYEQSDGELESSPTETTNSDEISTTILSNIASNQKHFTILPDINRLFENITTPKSIQPSTTTTAVRSSTIQPSEPTFPMKTTKRVYTTIPRRKASTATAFPDYNRTTISTFLSNISSRRNKTKNSTVPTPPLLISTTFAPYSTTLSYQTYKDSAKTLDPRYVEIVAPPSVIPESVTPSVQTNVFFQGVSTTNKPLNNEVLVEMQTVDAATYVMAGLGLLPLVVILIYVVRQYLYRHEHKDGDLGNYGNDIQPISPVVTLDQSDDASIDGAESIISETDFNRSDLRFKSLLGEGNFGQVWKAEADNLAGHIGSTRIVAVKTERANNGQGGLKAECEIMRKLGSHSNVVTLLGACVEQEPHLLIMEYAMRGRLLSLLRAARGVLNGLSVEYPTSRQPVMPLSPRRLTGFALDIARGMEYIAEKKIVHRDLAARNVLLDHNGICKICDFGMSIDLDKIKTSQGRMKIPRVSTYQNKFKFDMTARVFGGLKSYATSKTRNNCDTNKNRPALPIRWMAPEALQYHVYSVETDVFAFGIVLWELATLGITPYPTLSGREVLRGIPNGVRPEIPSNCRQELSETMTNCWHKDPNQRPSFTEVRKSLARSLVQWQEEITTSHSEYIDVSGFSEDYENGMIYFNRRVSEFECEI